MAQGRCSTIRLRSRLVGFGDVIRAKKCRQVVIDDIDMPRQASKSSETM